MSEPERDWMAESMEDAADRANAQEPVVDWEKLGSLETEAEELAARKELTREKVGELVKQARAIVPAERADVVQELERDLLALL